MDMTCLEAPRDWWLASVCLLVVVCLYALVETSTIRLGDVDGLPVPIHHTSCTVN